MENNKQKALTAIQKIDELVSQFKDIFPSPIAKLPNKKNGEQIDPIRTLKRVNGIIKGFNEENATRKLDSLAKFFDALRKRAT